MSNKKLLIICEKTINHFKYLIKNSKHKYIRIGIKSGGCNGFKYDIQTVTEKDKHDEIIKNYDVPIIVCSKSMLYLIGTRLSWKTSMISNGIEFDNPNAKSTCGCGETFSS